MLLFAQGVYLIHEFSKKKSKRAKSVVSRGALITVLSGIVLMTQLVFSYSFNASNASKGGTWPFNVWMQGFSYIAKSGSRGYYRVTEIMMAGITVAAYFCIELFAKKLNRSDKLEIWLSLATFMIPLTLSIKVFGGYDASQVTKS
jgi:hypothetical protein